MTEESNKTVVPFDAQARVVAAEARVEKKKKRRIEKPINGGGTEPQWPDIDRGGGPKKSYQNARVAIAALGIICRYDAFHDRMLVGGHVIHQWTGELSDAATVMLRQAIINAYGFDPGKENVNDAATALCLENTFDPVAEYLDGLKWDGTERLNRWLITYLGAEDTNLHCAISHLSLVAAVRRVRRPGSKSDHIVVLEGAEGTMKSTAIEVLAGTENFSDQTILTQSDREQQELVRGVWLYELADLAGMRRADVEKIKAFASRTHDRARPAYGRRRVDAPRRCVFFGTTNESEYLKSQTGNRRIWPVRTGRIDIEALRRDRDQLWAEAAMVEALGGPLYLPEELWADARAAQEERRVYDPWEDVLAGVTATIVLNDHGAEEERIFSRDLLLKLGKADKDLTSLDAQRLKHSMVALGWAGPTLMRIGHERRRGYSRPAQSPDSDARGESLENGVPPRPSRSSVPEEHPWTGVGTGWEQRTDALNGSNNNAVTPGTGGNADSVNSQRIVRPATTAAAPRPRQTRPAAGSGTAKRCRYTTAARSRGVTLGAICNEHGRETADTSKTDRLRS
jgi:virulence-associated protein E